MLKKALDDFHIDLEHSYFVGDKEIDIDTGKNAGIGHCILVRSGHSIDDAKTAADEIYDGIYDFAKMLLAQQNQL